MKKKALLASLLSLSLAMTLFSGCGKKEEAKESQKTQSESQAIESQVEEDDTSHPGMARSPYTGLWIDETVAAQRPIACMIENSKATLPQYGLNEADIIYECPVEGYMTRTMCVFQDYTKLVKFGNFRSCRTPFVPLALENNAIYIHCGGSPTGLALLDTGIIDHMNVQNYNAEKYLTIDTTRKAPHQMYYTGENVASALAQYDFDMNLSSDYQGRFTFTKDEDAADLSSGEDCAVFVPYYFEPDPYFIYNEETGYYERFEYGKEQVDGNSGEQIYVKNIIVQNTTTYEDGEYVFTTYTDGGDGYYISDGKIIPITWTKADDASAAVYYTADGEVLEINPGRTWVCISEKKYADKTTWYASVSDWENK